MGSGGGRNSKVFVDEDDEKDARSVTGLTELDEVEVKCFEVVDALGLFSVLHDQHEAAATQRNSVRQGPDSLDSAASSRRPQSALVHRARLYLVPISDTHGGLLSIGSSSSLSSGPSVSESTFTHRIDSRMR
jgi:hypothetical protein